MSPLLPHTLPVIPLPEQRALMRWNLGMDCRAAAGLVLPLTNCVTSGKLPDLFRPYFIRVRGEYGTMELEFVGGN